MSEPSSLKERISQDMKEAMRNHDSERLLAIRLLMAAIKQREVDERIILDDIQILAVIEKMIKQRNEAIKQFTAGGRDDLVAKESKELEVLKVYLPEQLSADEIEKIIQETIKAVNALTIKDMGKVMGAVKSKVQGRADMGMVSGRIKALLQG